jgi:hypothetical protein
MNFMNNLPRTVDVHVGVGQKELVHAAHEQDLADKNV